MQMLEDEILDLNPGLHYSHDSINDADMGEILPYKSSLQSYRISRYDTLHFVKNVYRTNEFSDKHIRP